MIVLAQIFCCFFMTGLIWTIQVLHYPSFAHVDRAHFKTFHDFHSRRITWIVLPLMSIELGTAGWLAWEQPGSLFLANLAGVILIWLATGWLSVPAHDKLASGYDSGLAEGLVVTNWARTILWSARSVLLATWLYGVL